MPHDKMPGENTSRETKTDSVPDAHERRLVMTADGSYTLFQPGVGEHYHSVNGAFAESRHVFLESGLRFFMGENSSGSLRVLEIGFGTGLNFLLSAGYCTEQQITLDYTGIEAYPLPVDLLQQTGYAVFTPENLAADFMANYERSFREEVRLNHFCTLRNHCVRWPDFSTNKRYDVLYFDAFASARQPEMWEDEPIGRAADLLKPGGVFVTYAITGKLKRQLKALNFKVEKAPGAPGKREMLRAVKNA